MSVFRRRIVFRDNRETRVFGSASIITSTTVAAAIVFAGTATGATPASTGSASGTIVFAGAPISQITIEVSGSGGVVLAGSAAGVLRNLGAGSGTIVLGGTARCDAIGSGAIVFSGSATVGSVFTMDASGAIVFGGTAASVFGATLSGSIVFAGSVGAPNVSGGVVSSAASGTISFTGTGTGSTGAAFNVPHQFYFDTLYNVGVAQTATSRAETILGNTQPASLIINNGEYSINGATFDSIATTVSAGDSIRLRHTSSDEYSTAVTTTLTLSGVTGTFVSVTEARPRHRNWRHRFSWPHRRRKS